MTEPINNEPLVQINLGTYSPLMDKNETSKKLTASLGSGNVLKTAKYQKNNWSNNGTFLKISIYISDIFAIK